MLAGLIDAYPQPSAISCCCAGGSAPGAAPRPVGAVGVIVGRAPAPLNIIITGTGPFASAGVTTVIWMSTEISGNEELSTCPTSCFPMTGYEPTLPSAMLATVQVTFGTFFGTRPR